MDVERSNHVVQSVSRRRVTACDEAIARTPQADISQPQRLRTIVGSEDAARRHDPGLTPRRQCVEISVDDGMLYLGKRRVGSFP